MNMEILIWKTFHWLNAIKISLNVQKTQLVIFEHQRKKIEMKLRLNLIEKDSIPQILLNILALELMKIQTGNITFLIKLNRANVLLFKISNSANLNTLKTTYYAIFDSHIKYANVVWDQNCNAVNRLSILQKRPWELLVFSQEIVIQALYLKNKIYLILKINFNLKMYSWSVNTSIIYYHQFSTTGSHFVLIYIIITQLPPL